MSGKQGFEMHGTKAIAIIFIELKQSDEELTEGKPVAVPIKHSLLTKKWKKEALDVVNLIKEKRNGDLKGRICKNGAIKRKYINDSEIQTSSTASLEAISIILIIDTFEERDVAVVDIPCAYLRA